MMQFLGRRLIRSGFSIASRETRSPLFLNLMKSPPRLIEDAATVHAARVKQLEKIDQQIQARKKLIDEYLKKEMVQKLKESMKAELDEAADDTLFKYCVSITSNRYYLRLKDRCSKDNEFSKELVGFVTRFQHQKARFMLFAMKEPSRFSVQKSYTSETASRAYATTYCPIVLFLVFLILKIVTSMVQTRFEDSKRELELNNRFGDFKKMSEGSMDIKMDKLKSDMKLDTTMRLESKEVELDDRFGDFKKEIEEYVDTKMGKRDERD